MGVAMGHIVYHIVGNIMGHTKGGLYHSGLVPASSPRTSAKGDTCWYDIINRG